MEQQQFARALANPDKAVRDKTVRELKKFLASVSSFDDVEMLKLWKALFYCLWLSDKAPIQEELCHSIASMMEVFQKPSLSYGKYLRSFFRIMLLEWDQLDQHRLNKFYTLIRVMLRKTFELLHAVSWAEKTANRFLEAITVEVFRKVPNGPRYHMCDIYLEELWNATEGQINHDHFMVAISPFFSALGTTEDSMFRSRLIEKVFQAFVESYARENRKSDFDLKLFDEVSTLNLQREIFDIASHPSEDICIDKNRRKAYDLHGLYSRFTGVKNVSDEQCEGDLRRDTTPSSAKKEKKKAEKKAEKKEEKKEEKKKDKKSKTAALREPEENGVMEMEVDEPVTPRKGKKEKADKKRPREAESPAPETPTTPSPGPPALFMASKKYTGSKPGYSFQRGKQGQGYYLDKRHPGYKSLVGSRKKKQKSHEQEPAPSTPKMSKKQRKEEESRRVRFGENIAKGYQDSVQSLKSANPALTDTPSKSAIRTPVKSSGKKATRASTPFAHEGQSSLPSSPRAKASSYF